ncbi:MAG: hypothetical protein GYA48_16395 [Chloroflexi bacterium]|nr:hypothetical protein [Chloroflexota bacterium]
MREDSIFDMGMAHPLLRRMFAELGSRFVAREAMDEIEDIYWLEENEVMQLVRAVDQNQAVENFSGRIPERKQKWPTYLKAMPPVMLPEKSG